MPDEVAEWLQHADLGQTMIAARDRHMAENTGLLAAEPGARIVLWAHNGHVMKSHYTGSTVPATGRHLADTYGDAYYAMGLLFGAGEFRARPSRFGRILRGRSPVRIRVPAASAPRIVEARLAAAHPGDYVVDLRGGGRPEAVAAWLGERTFTRGFGAVAGRFIAKTAFSPAVLGEMYDGLTFVPRTTCSTPL
ncbi:erythromycin esterase family protein [Nonomuraea sp. NPDC050404]|uniref:erythromycin esterase family protein n=1 Tax=Nonomuraea sp. NPDC050404 TaxID=3155783 RepID=UPI003409AB4C